MAAGGGDLAAAGARPIARRTELGEVRALVGKEPAAEGGLGLGTATALVVACMVGTGIFTTTGFLVRDLGSPLAVLAAWAVGGVLAVCGALSYAELVAAMPRNGGEYRLLGRIYHPAVGFAAGVVSLVVGFSAPIAASGLAFGHYLAAVYPGIDPRIAAVAVVAATAALHASHVGLGSRFQGIITVLQVALMIAFTVVGGARGEPSRLAGAGASAGVFSPSFAVALVYVSFAYSGWNGAAYVAGEVRRPSRTMPLSLLLGTGIVMTLYLSLNVVYLAAAPAAELSGVVEVGHVAATKLLGPGAGRALSGLVALVLASSVSAMTFAGPRVYQAMGEDYRALRFLAWRAPRGGPAAAVALQAALAIAMVLTSSFGALLTYVGFTLSLVSGLTVLGVFVSRWREPQLHRPYRIWGYPVTPLLFLALTAWMAVHALLERPAVTWAGLATIAGSLALHRFLARRPAGRSDAPR